MKGKTYDIFDLTKFILSIAVVAIHCQLFPQLFFPWVRLAVPLFFIISSFLFYSKVNDLDNLEQWNNLKNYIKRNLTLYIVWFFILLPFTIYERKSWFSEGIVRGLFCSIRGLLFGSTFRASWFIMASVIAMLLVFFMSKRIGKIVIMTIAFVLFGFCCLSSNYSMIIENSCLAKAYEYTNLIFGGIESSFFFALIWIVIGKAYATRKIVFSKMQAIVGLSVSTILLYIEHLISVNCFGSLEISSCYFMLIPVCIFIFQLLLRGDQIKVKSARFLRNSSTIIYVTHCAVLLCVSTILRKVFGINSTLIDFLITIAIVMTISFICIRLSKFSKFRFLKILW